MKQPIRPITEHELKAAAEQGEIDRLEVQEQEDGTAIVLVHEKPRKARTFILITRSTERGEGADIPARVFKDLDRIPGTLSKIFSGEIRYTKKGERKKN